MEGWRWPLQLSCVCTVVAGVASPSTAGRRGGRGEVSEPRCADAAGRASASCALLTTITHSASKRADELERTARLVRRHGWLALYALAAKAPIDNVERIL